MLVAARIQELRVEQGLSLEAIADVAGLHRTSVGLVVRGERGLTISSGAEIARALGVKLSHLIADAERQL